MESIQNLIKQNYRSESIPASDPNEIELTEEEREEVLAQARQRKFEIVENERKMKLREEMNLYYRSVWATSDFKDFVKAKMVKAGIVADESNTKVLNALCCYFNNDPVFETIEGLNSIGTKPSLQKGIFLFGPVGTGKTTIMNLFSANKKQSYQVVSCRKMVSEYVKNGEEVIEPLSRGSYYFIKNIDNFFQDYMGICFDDLGTESESANNYGNKKNVCEQLILDRYDNHLPFPLTHITSNLSPEMIGERYGQRVKSRMREMFNIIELLGKDRRK